MRRMSDERRGPTGSPDPEGLNELREQIDAIDRDLVELLNRRARVVVEVGKLKRDSGGPIYAPHREAAVLKRALEQNEGPLSDRTIEGIFRELMSGSFRIEQPLRIGYLGPPGSFSHVAATTHFGSSVSYENLREIGGVFTEVQRGHVDYGLVPIENSTGGAVIETLDAFKEVRTEVNVYAEVALAIRHSLLANCEPSQVRRIYSKPEVFAQCRSWLATQYPQAERIPAASTSQAVIQARTECDADPSCGSAAIGSSLAGKLYGVNVLFGEIEDNANNITRFFVIAKQQAKPSGDDKTSIMFTTENRPGALVDVLRCFDDNGINLSHIEKRPSGRENWSYTFFIDAIGHRDEPGMDRAVTAARKMSQELWILGSYPKATRIL